MKTETEVRQAIKNLRAQEKEHYADARKYLKKGQVVLAEIQDNWAGTKQSWIAALEWVLSK